MEPQIIQNIRKTLSLDSENIVYKFAGQSWGEKEFFQSPPDCHFRLLIKLQIWALYESW